MPHTLVRSGRRVPAAVLATLTALVLVVTLAPPADAWPTEAHCGTETGDTSVAGFIDHDELRERLDRIERTSQGRVDVEQVGTSNQGREIWSARVGDGDRVVLVQSEIHGNEKHGTTALLDVLSRLGSGNSPQVREILDNVTLVAIPKMNPDAAELDRRLNDMPWNDVVAAFPQLEGVQPAWNYDDSSTNRQNRDYTERPGFDVNRDFNPDLDYVPQPEDFPGTSADTGWYITPEGQTVRDVYADLEDEFGTVEVFVDLHNQAPCYWHEDEDQDRTSLSISGVFIQDPGEWADTYDVDASKRANLAVYDAVNERGKSPYGKVSLYPQNINLPGTALGSFALRGSAAVLFETIGQTWSMGQKQAGMLTKQVEVGLFGILDALADGSFDELDPDRYDDIPTRTTQRPSTL